MQCFENSRSESLRRRQNQISRYDARLAELRNAVTALPGADLTAYDVSQLVGRAHDRASTDPQAEARMQRSRAVANWDPTYPGENIDFYQEYIHRHAHVDMSWLDVPNARSVVKDVSREATGVGLLDHDHKQHVLAPLDDGSICIWDLSRRLTSTSGGGGKLIAQSKAGLLTGQAPDATSASHGIMTDTGAVECVAVDTTTARASFAVQNWLHEVDVNTFQLISSKQYPWPITALSEAQHGIPITVGTNLTIHLHDPRDQALVSSGPPSSGELIGGSIYSNATLAQPGPLSILHHAGDESTSDHSIWVAGRFTSLLNYDRRFFPRLRGTIFSGARIASLTSMPRPFIPRNLDLLRNPSVSFSEFQSAKSNIGSTILAAAEYKGKGSLELYGLPDHSMYQNRQTASASKLLSAAPHAGRIVFSDGDGNLKWVERDGFSHVRTYNINDANTHVENDASAYGLWSSTASELPGQGDIVQKILPMLPITNGPNLGLSLGRPDINQDRLLLWTGDGRLGMFGFGCDGPLHKDDAPESWHDAVDDQAQAAREKAIEQAERQYAQQMRRELERSANEVRFVRRLGMGFMRH